jgi:hypothetical protein
LQSDEARADGEEGEDDGAEDPSAAAVAEEAEDTEGLASSQEDTEEIPSWPRSRPR